MKYITAFIIFLLPIKFATIANLPEMPLWLFNNIIYYIIVPFPVSSFSAISAILLLFSIWNNDSEKDKKYPSSFIFIIISLAIISFLGIKNASVNDYVWREISYIFGITAFSIATYIQLKNDKDTQQLFLTAISLGALVSIIYGGYQLFEGFEETRKFLVEHEKNVGVNFMKGNFKSRVMESRVYAYFGMCNSFAGYLILIIPIFLLSLKNYLKKYQLSSKVNIAIVSIISTYMLFILYHTGSRAAIACFAIGLIPILIKLGKKGIFVGIGAYLIIIGLFLGIGRDLASFTYRVDYWYSAFEMMRENILFGTGWGDFFHDYMRTKELVNPEAPHVPHNLILAFASQAGILGLIVSSVFILYPIFIYIKKIKNHSWLQITLISGWTSWSLHSLSDFNLQIPASMSIAIILALVYLLSFESTSKKLKSFGALKTVIFSLIMISSLIFSYNILKQDILLGKMNALADPKYSFKKTKPEDNYIKVREHLNICSKEIPLSPFPYIDAANFAINSNNFLFAEQCLVRAAELSPERASIFYKLSRLQFSLKKFKEAEKNYRIAKELFPHKYNVKK